MLMLVYDVVLVQCKKTTKFGCVPNIHGAHAIIRLGKPSFKKENLFIDLCFSCFGRMSSSVIISTIFFILSTSFKEEDF